MKASPNTIAFQKLVFITNLSSEFYYLCYGSDCHYSHSENFYFNDSMNAYHNFLKHVILSYSYYIKQKHLR